MTQTGSTSEELSGLVTGTDKYQEKNGFSTAQPYRGKLSENARTTHIADYIQQQGLKTMKPIPISLPYQICTFDNNPVKAQANVINLWSPDVRRQP